MGVGLAVALIETCTLETVNRSVEVGVGIAVTSVKLVCGTVEVVDVGSLVVLAFDFELMLRIVLELLGVAVIEVKIEVEVEVVVGAGATELLEVVGAAWNSLLWTYAAAASE
jgi:hypothetical protein